jgi:arylsulfatase A-like enzyme
VDFMPTFAEMAGAKLPQNQPVDGKSFTGLLKGENILKDRSIFWHFPLYLLGVEHGRVVPVFGTHELYWRATPSSMIMNGDWKLIHFFEDNSIQLYNVKEDIGEKNELSKSNPEMAKKLFEELKTWQKDTKAVIPAVLNESFDSSGGKSKKRK